MAGNAPVPIGTLVDVMHRSGKVFLSQPSSPRRDLVKAVALGLAEIERLDRAERIADADCNYGETR